MRTRKRNVLCFFYKINRRKQLTIRLRARNFSEVIVNEDEAQVRILDYELENSMWRWKLKSNNLSVLVKTNLVSPFLQTNFEKREISIVFPSPENLGLVAFLAATTRYQSTNR